MIDGIPEVSDLAGEEARPALGGCHGHHLSAGRHRLALFATKRGWGESPLLYGWMGLLISLGWNFLRLGLNPPEFMASTWGWIVSGVVFGIMGLVPVGFVVSWAIDAFKDARAGNPQSTISGRPTRGLYLALQVAGVAVGIIGGNALNTAVTGV